jgi:hypothetical protein
VEGNLTELNALVRKLQVKEGITEWPQNY